MPVNIIHMSVNIVLAKFTRVNKIQGNLYAGGNMAITLKDAKKLSSLGEFDVIVAGGGPAGTAAGITAARMGLKTIIIEQFNCLGGVATAGGHGHICLYSSWGSSERVVGGVIYEMAVRTAKAGFGIVTNSAADFEIEGMKLVLDQMAEEANVKLLYHAFAADAIMDGTDVAGVVVQSKSGRQAAFAKRVVDCTGDGDVGAQAGCDYDQGNPEGHCQPVTLMFTIGGVNYEKVQAFRGRDYQLKDLWKKAQDDGNMRPFQSQIMGWWWTPTRPDQIGVNFTHINYINATDVEDLTRATIEGRKQCYETIDIYRKYVPGMENCYMVSTPNTIGVRETRRIAGHYQLTREDILSKKAFEDSIGYGSFFIDIHSTHGPGMDERTHRPNPGFKYAIPYRITVPKNVGNLFVAGRSASVSHEALGSIRVMPQCGVMGQATGAAAVLSIKSGVSPADVDIRELQNLLRGQGCILDEAGIAKANEQ